MFSILTNPYLLAHTVGLASQVIISLYVLTDMMRTREKRILLSFGIFLAFALAELSLILYYLRNGSVFDLYTSLDAFTWMLAASFLLLSSTAVATLSIYLLEYKVFYLVPTFAFIFSFYTIFYTYSLFKSIFTYYIKTVDVVKITFFISMLLILVVALAGEVLFALIYTRTRSLRVLTFIIGTAFMGFVDIGWDILLEVAPDSLSGLLPSALIRQIIGLHDEYKFLWRGWSLNALYIVINVIFLLGQTNVLDALAKFRRRGRTQKAWIEKMLEEA